MSRHILKPRPDVSNVVSATTGWDRPLQTYFAQVFTAGEDEDEDEIFIWVGTEPGELPTPEAAIAVLAPYALIPEDLAATLQADMEATIGQKDSAHLAQVKRSLFGPLH